jgi:nucleoside-diphosphate-sugar epimerase
VFNNLHIKIFVLGAEGFVGRNIVTGVEKTFDQVFALSRKEFELGNVKHYSKFAFSDSIIVDCISKIDGSPEDIYSNNYENFTTFIDYLAKHDTSFRYVYLSTLTTNDSELTSTNAYVKSKYLAEQY